MVDGLEVVDFIDPDLDVLKDLKEENQGQYILFSAIHTIHSMLC